MLPRGRGRGVGGRGRGVGGGGWEAGVGGSVFDPWSGNYTVHTTARSTRAANKAPACRNKDPVQPNK